MTDLEKKIHYILLPLILLLVLVFSFKQFNNSGYLEYHADNTATYYQGDDYINIVYYNDRNALVYCNSDSVIIEVGSKEQLHNAIMSAIAELRLK